METKRRVLLIDLSALFRAAYHALPPDVPLSSATQSTLGGVRRAIAMSDDPLVAICCDGKGNWRKELSSEYKAHREKQPPAMYGELDRVIKRLSDDGYMIWKCDGFEADDVIATATASAKVRGHEVRIVTHDKDLLQLVCPAVDWLSSASWETRDNQAVIEKFGVEASQLGDYLALVGDKADGLKGAPGIGKVTAADLLLKYPNLDALFAAVDAKPEDFTPGVVKALTQHRESVKLDRKLIAMRTDAPITFDDIYVKREQKPLADVDEDDKEDIDFNDSLISAGHESGSNDTPDDPAVTELSASRHAATENAMPEKAEPAHPPASDLEKASSVQKADAGGILQVVTQNVTDVKPADGENAGRDQTASNRQAATDLVLRPDDVQLIPVEYSHALEPRSFRDALVLAKYLHNSRLYQKFKGPDAIAAVIMRGREMGYGAGTSLDVFHVIEETGQLAMYAHLIIARVMAGTNCAFLRCTETTEQLATYEYKDRRDGHVTRLTYTIEQAKTANLVKLTYNGKPNNWMKRPSELLRKTCGVQLGRIVDPSAALGLYAVEELTGDTE